MDGIEEKVSAIAMVMQKTSQTKADRLSRIEILIGSKSSRDELNSLYFALLRAGLLHREFAQGHLSATTIADKENLPVVNEANRAGLHVSVLAAIELSMT